MDNNLVSVVKGNDFILDLYVSKYDKDQEKQVPYDVSEATDIVLRLIGNNGFIKVIRDAQPNRFKITANVDGHLRDGKYGVELLFKINNIDKRIYQANKIEILNCNCCVDAGAQTTQVIPTYDLSMYIGVDVEKINFGAVTYGNIDSVLSETSTNPVMNKTVTAALKEAGKISDVLVNGESVVKDKVAEIIMPTKVSELDNDAGYLTEHQSLTDYAKISDVPVIPTKLSAFNNDEGFIKNTVTDLVNYYKKSETYTHDEVNELISKIPKFAIDVVDELPTSEISLTTVYLVKTSETADNMYAEYIYVNNVWEKLGEQKVDLTDYYTKNQIDNFLNEKADKTEIPDMKPYAKISDVDASLAKYTSTDSFNALNTEVLKKANKSYVDETFQVKGDYITEIPAEYVTETELEGKGYLTEHQSLTDYAKKTDIVTYKSGNGITINADNTINALIGKGKGEGSLLGPNATSSTGKYAVSLGYHTVASGAYSHAEGYNTTASGYYSHAEGYTTNASGDYSHAEGYNTNASGDYSHAEGYHTVASNTPEHASGQYNISNKASDNFGDAGNTLFSVGNGISFDAKHNAFEIRQNGDIYIADSSIGAPYKLQDKLNNFATKSEINSKQDTLVSGTSIKTVNGESILGAGNITIEAVDLTDYAKKTDIPDTTNFATKDEIPTIPSFKTINGEEITGVGDIEIKSGGSDYTAGEGINITNNVISSVFFKRGTDQHSIQIIDASQASGLYSLSLGYHTVASGDYSHAEGYTTKASGAYSHAEGNTTKALSYNSHAEGYNTTASGYYSHAEGSNTTASGYNSHAEGYNTKASGYYSHAEGIGTKTSNTAEHASGQYNISNKASDNFGDAGNTLFSVGNGLHDNDYNIDYPHNAFEIRQNGDIYIADSSNGAPYKLQDKLNNFATKSEIPTVSSFKTINGEEITGTGNININIDTTIDQIFNPNGSNPISGKGVGDILFKEYPIPAGGASNPKYIKVSYTIDNTMQPAPYIDGLTVNITSIDSSITKKVTGKVEVTHNGSEWHVTGLSVTGTGLTGIYYSDSYAIFKVEGYTRAIIDNYGGWGPLTPSAVITYYTYDTDIYDNPTLNNPTITGTIKANIYDMPNTTVSDSFYMLMSNTRDNTIKKINIWDAISQAEPKLVKSNKEGIKIWTGTQAEYDAITTKDDNTVYFVK